MQSQFVATVLIALSLLAAGTLAAQAQMYDPDGRYSGGQPGIKRYEFFGGMLLRRRDPAQDRELLRANTRPARSS